MKMVKVFTSILVLAFLCVETKAQSTPTDTLMVSKPKNNFTLFKGHQPYRTWSAGVHTGALAPVVLARSNTDFTNWSSTIGYGVYVRKQLAHSFGLEFNLMGGRVAGNNKDAVGGIANSLKNYETDMWGASLQGVVNVATVDFFRKENWINFLIKAGYGKTAYSYTLTDENDNVVDYSGTYGAAGNKKYRYEQYLPVGVGVKFKISNRLNFDLGYTMNFLGSDDFDGTFVNRTPHDKFSYAYSGLEFSIGKRDKPNLDWMNPIALMYDDLYMRNDSAELAALKRRVSRVEKDIDDLKCDTDSDGVGDLFDKCPSTPKGVVVSGAGCPLDTDQDGVDDSMDKCPLVKGPKENNGCPVVEKVQIPVKPTIVLTVEEQKILQDVFENLEFATGKWTIKATSFPSLDKLALLMVTKPNYSLKISGHTDAVGSEKSNQTLSVNRANAVKAYLNRKGVSKNKIEARGYGESQPIADNETDEGRQKNRRVEFNIF